MAAREEKFAEKKKALLLALPRARSLRELARLSRLSLSTVERLVDKMKQDGNFKLVPDDDFFGLARVVAFAPGDAEVKKVPIGTNYVRCFRTYSGPVKVIGAYVPRALAPNYIADLKKHVEIAGHFTSTEYAAWIPTAETLAEEVDITKLSERVLVAGEGRKDEASRGRVPDDVDLKLLVGKLVYGPFIRAAEILIKLSRRVKIKLLPKQTLSYHYRNHLLPGWRATTYHEYKDEKQVPFVGLYLKGKEAGKVAKILAMLPYSGVAAIAENKAFYMGQLKCSLYPQVAELVAVHNAKAPFGLMYMKLELVSWIPPLWVFVKKEGKKWRWRWHRKSLLVKQRTA